MPSNFAFAGTPEFAARILGGLLQCGLRPILVLTGPDRRRGRGRKTSPSPVRQLALTEGLAVKTPQGAADAAAALAGPSLDTVVVAAYGIILPKAFLDLPRYGCVNVHASLLPRWRGAAPIERAIMAGDAETGVSIMRIDEGLDRGPIFAQAKVPIGPESDSGQLSAQIADLGTELLCDLLPKLADAQAKPQTGPATYAGKLTAADALADWHQPASRLARAVRALAQRMPVHGQLGDVRVQLLAVEVVQGQAGTLPGRIIRANRREIVVACGVDALNLKSLRLNLGKGAALDPAAAVNGFGRLFQPGACFRGQ